jgi:hemerythrin-like metal-binding protein
VSDKSNPVGAVDLGVESIDSDHRLQIRTVESIENAIRRGASEEVIGPLLAGLAEHTKAHFSAERALMRNSEYPDLEEHLREHDRLLRQLDHLIASYSEHRVQTALDVLHALRPWLLDHIDLMDRSLAEHLRRRGDFSVEKGDSQA